MATACFINYYSCWQHNLNRIMGRALLALCEKTPGGYFRQNCTWMCLPDLDNLTLSIQIFRPISHPSVYHFQTKKHPILPKFCAFYNNMLKIHPIYVIWAPSSLMKTHQLLYQISKKCAPKGRHIYVYHVNVRTPQKGLPWHQQESSASTPNQCGWILGLLHCVDVVL